MQRISNTGKAAASPKAAEKSPSSVQCMRLPRLWKWPRSSQLGKENSLQQRGRQFTTVF